MNMGNVVLTLAAINAVMYENGKERKLPFRVKLHLSRTKEILEKEARVYESERVRLVNEYGDETTLENGAKSVEVKDPEKLDKFYKELEEVLKTEVDSEYFKLSQEDLALIEDIDIEITEPQIRAFMEFAVEK